MRLAWFSPMPPTRSGIAAYSAELLPLLRPHYDAIDVFLSRAPARDDDPARFSAHDFVWKHRRQPYDLTVFQLGNDACHDYMWAYLFRYPGLVVLHDAQLNQARALWLTKRWPSRRDDYLAEFRANHPDARPALGDLFAEGHGEFLYQRWPLVRLVLESARLGVVHNRRLRDSLRESSPAIAIDSIEMGVSDIDLAAATIAAPNVRERHGIPRDAVVIAAFGGLTPEKRIGPLLRAASAMAERHAMMHVMLVGGETEHYSARREARRWGIADRVHITRYVPDADLPAYLAASDVCACLRWPTNRETSASWLRCLAAGRPTIITDLTHLTEVPTFDPRGWSAIGPQGLTPVAVSIDIMDEHASLKFALDRLIEDRTLRAELGAAARVWWHTHHRLERMASDYQRIISRAASLPVPQPSLPRHLTADGTDVVRAMARELDVEDRVSDLLR